MIRTTWKAKSEDWQREFSLIGDVEQKHRFRPLADAGEFGVCCIPILRTGRHPAEAICAALPTLRRHPAESAVADAGTVLALTWLMDGKAPKLLDRVRQAIRGRHYSRRTEEAYIYWIRRYIVFHGKVHPASLGAVDLSAFLSWLAEHQHVSASTQNQALSAVLFLYKAVLAIEIGGVPPVVRARTAERLPVVLSRDEVTAL